MINICLLPELNLEQTRRVFGRLASGNDLISHVAFWWPAKGNFIRRINSNLLILILVVLLLALYLVWSHREATLRRIANYYNVVCRNLRNSKAKD
jgi:hypothetical protein